MYYHRTSIYVYYHYRTIIIGLSKATDVNSFPPEEAAAKSEMSDEGICIQSIITIITIIVIIIIILS